MVTGKPVERFPDPDGGEWNRELPWLPVKYIPVNIGDLTYSALVDSGSSSNLMSADLARWLGLLVYPSELTFNIANSDKLTTVGKARVPVSIAGVKKWVWFGVCEGLLVDVILGLPALGLFKIRLDFERFMFDIPVSGIRRSYSLDFGPSKPDVGVVREGATTDPPTVYESIPLTKNQERAMEELFKEFSVIFNDVPGECNLPPIRFNLKEGTQPIRRFPYRFTGPRLDQMRKHLTEMQAQGIIEPYCGPWSFPAFVVPKPHGQPGSRFVCDFRALNQVLVQEPYPLPTIVQQLAALEGSAVFSALDLSSGYHQLRLHEESSKLATITTPFGNYRYKRLPQGVLSGTYAFQAAMDQILGDCKWRYASPYLDDILIFSKNIHDHLSHLRDVFTRLRDAGLTIKKSKCHLFMSKLRYLGHVISADGIRPDPTYIDAVQALPSPTSRKELQKTLGRLTWTSKFIPNYSVIARPLFLLLKKGAVWEWTSEHEACFRRLKDLLTKNPVLAHPDMQLPFILQTDASARGYAAVLYQVKEDGLEHPVAYISRSTTPLEAVRASVELELGAVMWACEKLRPFLDGAQFTLRTDASALTWLKQLKCPTGRLGRWSLALQDLSFQVQHVRGRDNYFADALSRHPREHSGETLRLPVSGPVLRSLRQSARDWENRVITAQQADPYCTQKSADSGTSASSPFVVLDGILYKFSPIDWADPDPYKLVVPTELVKEVLNKVHDSPEHGHLGIARTLAKMRMVYFWPSMTDDVRLWVSSCQVCQSVKPYLGKKLGKMHTHTSLVPWQTLTLDLVGPLPRSTKGTSYVLVVVDLATKWTELFPLRQATSATIIKCLRSLFSRLGAPGKILSDNGTQFTSGLMRKELWLNGVHPIFVTPYHAQANITERYIQSLKRLIRSFVGDDHRLWDQYLPEFQTALNSAPNTTSGFSPADLFLGRPLYNLMDRISHPKFRDLPRGLNETQVNQRMEHFIKIRGQARENQSRALEAYKRAYDRSRLPNPFVKGDTVGIRTHYLSKAGDHFAKGLAPRWNGPWLITDVGPGDVLHLRNSNSGARAVRHVSQVRPWTVRVT